jgi:CRISPR system Cascade subunit CasE
MPYLSRIWINPLRQQSQRLLSQPQAMHAAVLGGLPTQPVDERVLWRLDTDEPRRPSLLVLTRSRPSWEHLVEQASWPSAEESQAETRDYTPLLEQVESGRMFAFRLTANPVQSSKRPMKMTESQAKTSERVPRTSHRLGHRTVEHQTAWLLQRAESWGVRFPKSSAADEDDDAPPADVRITARNRLSFQRRAQASRVVLQVVTYEGHLVIDDAERLRHLLLAGIGRAKAYGCGLLTLAPSGRS